MPDSILELQKKNAYYKNIVENSKPNKSNTMKKLENAEKILIRSSSSGKISMKSDGLTVLQKEKVKTLSEKDKVTDKQQEELNRLIYKRDNPVLHKTTQNHLIEVFSDKQYNRREEIKSKFLDKGNDREEDSLTLLSRVTKKLYVKNSIRLENEYMSGETDAFEGEEIKKATETVDTKTSWSLITFLKAKHSAIDHDYKWQGISYMWLTGAKKHTIAYCLVNATEKAISDEKRQLSYRYNEIDVETNEEYVEKCKKIEINHIFDIDSFVKEYPHFEFHNNIEEWDYDIPMEDRVHIKEVFRDEQEIEYLKKKVVGCRVWMNENLFN